MGIRERLLSWATGPISVWMANSLLLETLIWVYNKIYGHLIINFPYVIGDTTPGKVEAICDLHCVFALPIFSDRQIILHMKDSKDIPEDVPLMDCGIKCMSKQGCKAIEFRPTAYGNYSCRTPVRSDKFTAGNTALLRMFPVPTPAGEIRIY